MNSNYLLKIVFIKCTFLLLLILLQGCTSSYTVKVSSFLDSDKPVKITPGTVLHVADDKEAKNPLLDKEVTKKLENMLKMKGYSISQSDGPHYYVLHGYGIGQERTVTRSLPVYQPGGTATVTKTGPSGTSYSTIQLPGSTTYVPYTTAVTDKWLSLKIIDGKDYRDSGKVTDIWIGEASVTGEGRDLRYMLNYLILGIFEYFGESTGKELAVNIREDDPRIKTLMAR
jgi:hypothetical protein